MTQDQPIRTFVCSVVYVDLVGYSKRSVSEQITVKEAFNRHLASALREIPVADRIILDTGDGAALSFLGDPEEALFVALALRDSIEDATAGHVSGGAHGGEPGRIRVGINLGPVKLASDVNGHSTIVGDGINVAETIMGFAKPGKIAVSRSFFEMVSRLSPDYAKLFEYKGSHTDELVRDHEIYVVEQTDHAFRLAQRGMRGHHADEIAAAKAAEEAAKHAEEEPLPFVTVAPRPAPAGSGSALVDFLEDGWKVAMTAGLLIVLISFLTYLHWQRRGAKPPDAIAAATVPNPATTAAPAPAVTPPVETPVQSQPAREPPPPVRAEPAKKTEPAAPAKSAPAEPKPGKPASPSVIESRIVPAPAEPRVIEPPPRRPEPSPEAARAAARKAEAERIGATAATARPRPAAPLPASTLPVQPPAPAVEAPKEVAPAQNVSLNSVVPISRPPPIFPREAAKEGIESGKVRARLRIDSSGNVFNVNILESNPPRVFDRAARAALTTWKFNAGADNRTFEIEIGFQR